MLRHEGPSPKSLDLHENFSPNIRFLVAILRFVAIHALFGRPIKGLFAYHTELNLQICVYAQKQRIVAKIANTRLTNIGMPIFAFAERLPTSATLDKSYTILLTGKISQNQSCCNSFVFLSFCFCCYTCSGMNVGNE